MSLRKTLGKLFIFGFLGLGTFAGVPMTPEQIANLMQIMHRTKVERVEKKENGEDDLEVRGRPGTTPSNPG